MSLSIIHIQMYRMQLLVYFFQYSCVCSVLCCASIGINLMQADIKRKYFHLKIIEMKMA